MRLTRNLIQSMKIPPLFQKIYTLPSTKKTSHSYQKKLFLNQKLDYTPTMTKTLQQIQDTYKDLGTMNAWELPPVDFAKMRSEKWEALTVWTGATHELQACHENETFWKVYTC